MTEPFGHSDVITGHVDLDDGAMSVWQLDRRISHIAMKSLRYSDKFPAAEQLEIDLFTISDPTGRKGVWARCSSMTPKKRDATFKVPVPGEGSEGPGLRTPGNVTTILARDVCES